VHVHEVVAGEHLGLIAGRYGVLRGDILALNPELTDPDLIRPGQKLAVCPEIAPRALVAVDYEVRAGDNLVGIARAHGLTTREILEGQSPPLTDPDLIRPGQRLRLWLPGDVEPGFSPTLETADDQGSLASSHRLGPGAGYRIKRPQLAWGTPSTIAMLRRVFDRYHRRADGGPAIHVGDISRRGGGPLRGHVSHQRGVDVDLGLVLEGEHADRMHFSGVTPQTLDVRRTWLLVHELLRTGQVRYIFLDYRLQKLLYEHARRHGMSERELDEYFQYPRGRGRNHGIIRHWKGHAHHLHVRFRS
jgi:LysM repeat protein